MANGSGSNGNGEKLISAFNSYWKIIVVLASVGAFVIASIALPARVRDIEERSLKLEYENVSRQKDIARNEETIKVMNAKLDALILATNAKFPK